MKRILAIGIVLCVAGLPAATASEVGFLEDFALAPDRDKALEYFEKSCRGGIVPGCFSVADIYRRRQDELLARQWLRQGCEISQRYAQARSAYFKPGSSKEDSLPAVCAQLE